MKNITFFLILFSLFILASCPDPLNTPEPQPQMPSIPKGKGLFTLVISDINGRTILPTTSNFAEYLLEFYDDESKQLIKKEARTNASLPTNPITLDVGKYYLHVTAYIMNNGEGKPAAYGELLNIEIKDGQNNTGKVSLKVFVTGKGTFRWNISFPSGLTEASMTITPLSANGTLEQTLYFIGGTTVTQNNGSCELNSGYYNVLLTLIRDNDYQRIERRDILHIYPNLESVYPVSSFSLNDFYKNNYIVTFVYNDGVHTINGMETVEQGGKLTEPDPSKSGYVFDGWYTDGTFDEDKKWDFDTPVSDNITLYAKWMTAGTFTFQFKIADGAPVVDTQIIIDQSMEWLTTTTLEVSDADDYSPITWYYNGTNIGNAGTLTLKPSDFDNVSGPKFITVVAEKDGASYSMLVIIWVRLPAAKIGTTLYATLAAAIEAATTGTQTAPEEIIIMRDITTPETGIKTGGYTIDNGQHILLTVRDCNIAINASAGNFPLFTVNSGASLTLDASSGNLTLNGGGLTATTYTSRRGIYIDGGAVAVKDNVVIAGFKCSNTYPNYGGGVYVNGGTFTMSGGTVYGNVSNVPESQRNEAYSYAAIYVGNGTAKYDGRYSSYSSSSTGSISSTSSTLPPNSMTLSGILSIDRVTVNSYTYTYTQLNAVYTGSETVSYQWSNSSGSISGATNPMYIPATNGTYTVTVSAPGYTSKTESVTVNTSDLVETISINPAGLIQPGTMLTATYNGNEPVVNNVTINYQWLRESSSSTISGANTSMYMPTDPGIYFVRVSGIGYSNKPSDTAAFITTDTVTPLSNNTWEDGNFTTTSQQDWYFFEVSAGTTYYVWINNSNYGYGDGTKTANSYLSIIYDDGKIVCLEQYYYYTWGPVSFKPTSSGKVYLQVKPYSSIGTYGIVYSSTETTRPINNTLNPVNTQTLTEDTWRDGKLSDTDSQDWYSFNVTSGDTYYVWWNEKTSYLSNTKNDVTLADVDVTAWYDDGKEAFANTDTSWWSTPKSFTANTSGKITLQIRPKSALSSNRGDYQIVYSKSSAKPDGNEGDWTVPASSVSLTDGTWADGTLSNSNQQDWYSFDVTEGNTYRVWWYDYYDNYSTQWATVTVGGCYGDNGEVFFYDQTSGSSAKSFTAAYSGTVYLRVKYSSRTGSYRIVFSTGANRP